MQDDFFYETTPLTMENIPLIASRSNKTEDELKAMLMLMDLQGKQISVRYRLLEAHEKEALAPAPKKHFWQRGKKK